MSSQIENVVAPIEDETSIIIEGNDDNESEINNAHQISTKRCREDAVNSAPKKKCQWNRIIDESDDEITEEQPEPTNAEIVEQVCSNFMIL